MKTVLASLITLVSASAFATPQVDFIATTYVLPREGTSCAATVANNLPASIFSVSHFALMNKSDNSLKIKSVQIAIQDSRNYVCDLSGEELAAMGFGAEIKPHTTVSASCDIKCGGVLVGEGDSHSAILTVDGIETDRNGQKTETSVTEPLTILNGF